MLTTAPSKTPNKKSRLRLFNFKFPHFPHLLEKFHSPSNEPLHQLGQSSTHSKTNNKSFSFSIPFIMKNKKIERKGEPRLKLFETKQLLQNHLD